MSLIDSLQKDMIAAMKSKDRDQLSTIRMLKAALSNEKINLGHDLSPEEENAVLSRELKQRKESLKEYKLAGRNDSVKKINAEILVVQSYLPKQLNESEIEDIVKKLIVEMNATSMNDFGKVMKMVMPKVKGKADGNLVNKIVRSSLK